jgi:molybdenum cofactor cytidylyltransferase
MYTRAAATLQGPLSWVVFMIAAVILTAGASSRMGVPKANLKIGDTSFLNSILSKINRNGFEPVFIVTGYHHQEISRSISPEGTYHILQNLNPEQGQLSSLQLVIRSLSETVTGLLVALVDHPLVQDDTYCKIYFAAKTHPDAIILPQYQGLSGHPVYFSRKFFSALLETPLQSGAREMVRKNQEAIIYLEVPDAGVIRDIDTPGDLITYRGDLSA